MNEFEIIRRFFSRPLADENVRLGIGDDAAVVSVPAGEELVLAMDTLLSGVHFTESTAAADIGWKSLAVNLSDLAAMGATPCWATLSLTLPEADESWLQAFAEGFFELADQSGVSLIGGDTCRGPLSITVQAHGLLPAGEAITRNGARPGDMVFVTGVLGDAGYALLPAASQSADYDYFRRRLDRPVPRICAGQLLRGLATSAIDLSDGLAGDIRHIMQSSGCGAVVNVMQLPLSKAMQNAVDQETAAQLALTAGDDYELCFTLPPDKMDSIQALSGKLDMLFTHIGEITAERELIFRADQGRQDYSAYTHFS